MKRKGARRKPGRPGSKAKSARRAKARASVRDKQAAHGLEIDDPEHGKAEIPLHLFAKGRIIKRHLQCGKKDCACHKGGKKHGPYYYLVVSIPSSMRGPDDPKQRWFYLTKEEAERFRARIRNYNRMAESMFADMLDELRSK